MMEGDGLQGIILRGIGGFYYALDESGAVNQLRAQAKIRRERLKPLVGDRIEFEPGQGEEDGWVKRILPRTTELVRPPVANIDLIVIVAAVAAPDPDLLLVDRLMVNARRAGIGVRLVVNKFIYRFRAPEKGEILVFQYPRDPSRDFIKRVIAVPGDTVEIKDGRVLVNDQVLSEDYILEKTRGDYPKSTVPQGTVFVMGDNRNNSEDSRFADVGFVPDALIKGKAVLVFWPVADLKSLP